MILDLLEPASDLQQRFAETYSGETARASAPMAILGFGVMAMLLAEIWRPLRALKPAIFLGSLALSAYALVGILLDEPGPVFAGTLLADRTTALWGILFLVATALAWVYSIGYYREEEPFKGEHDALMLTAPVGMMMMVGARDLLVFFIGLELLSIPLYALAAFRRGRLVSVEAGIKYFLLGTFATGLLLYGTALLYVSEGTLSIDVIMGTGLSGTLSVVGVALIAAAVFFKVSVFPFHLWVPDVYEGSPTPVTALMATGTKAAAFGFLIAVGLMLPVEAATLIGVLALVTMAAGNLGALVQDDLKRMLAYSGVAHAGTLLLVVAGLLASGQEEALRGATNAALFYMGAYVFAATGAFGVVALLEADGERFTKLSSLRGLARTRPGAAAALALFMLSLAGIPATGGFLAKWFVFSVLVDARMYAIAVVGALLTVVALGYYLRVLVTLYMQPQQEDSAPPRTLRPFTAGVATVVCVLFTVLMGVWPRLFLEQLI